MTIIIRVNPQTIISLYSTQAVTKIISTVYKYIRDKTYKGAKIVQIAKAVAVNRQAINETINRGPKRQQKKGNRRQQLGNINKFICDLVCRGLHFYENGISPTVTKLFIKLQ